ncbi:hypothetical protein KIPB_011144 [Kipferlia bialata]|uniref:Uncharacterized protein n=1 Tax=Kipferlia bialata TaxID=797122 RepID=A0A391NQD8_9EUKA|nr:hypothetical protein KIPB_011144 [Kipferlia bialata]|eukprot:g11144.t1
MGEKKEGETDVEMESDGAPSPLPSQSLFYSVYSLHPRKAGEGERERAPGHPVPKHVPHAQVIEVEGSTGTVIPHSSKGRGTSIEELVSILQSRVDSIVGEYGGTVRVFVVGGRRLIKKVTDMERPCLCDPLTLSETDFVPFLAAYVEALQGMQA